VSDFALKESLRTRVLRIAALSIEHGCELITTDSDFARFLSLRRL
jgi:predicted nucleic acid-binding protein